MIIPDRLVTTLKTSSEYIPTDESITGTFLANLKMNSTADPMGDVSNSRPSFLTVFELLYERVKVEHCSVILNCRYDESIESGRLVIYPSYDQTTVVSIGAAQTSRYSKWLTLTGSNSTVRQNTLRNSIAVSKFEGRGLDSVNYDANPGSDPSYTRYWCIEGDVDDGTVTGVRMQITMYQRCVFFRPKYWST